MDMHEKMCTCKHHIEGYLEDTCDIDGETYNFDDPDNAYYLWLECKDCNKYERKEACTE
jgi:hypothetical protein